MLLGRHFLFRNGESFAADCVPVVPLEEFRRTLVAALREGWRVTAMFGRQTGPSADAVRLFALLGCAATSELGIFACDLPAGPYPSLTPDCPQVHWFEREIAQSTALIPQGHPQLRPVRSLQPEDAFFRVQGDDLHEVAVGPVHAGIIEPGHFRFMCHGERVLHLEIALGYQHRGLEKALIGGPDKRTVYLAETAAGDTTVGHTLAYSQIVEALSGLVPPARGKGLRALALELERIANHVGDLGALAGDIGFLPTAAYCGRLRGDFLNLTALVCGSRFGRGWIRPGGCGFDLDAEKARKIANRLMASRHDLRSAINLFFVAPSVLGRFVGVGCLDPARAESLGLVGPPARACGIVRDVRHEFPTEIYRVSQIPVATWHSGGVYARAYVRWLEIQRSLDYVLDLLQWLPEGAARADSSDVDPGGDRMAVSLVEGWRGEICHVAETDDQGRFKLYKIVDPSCHNWMGVAVAMREQDISDFPLCNKSFNLSYCGHDL